MTNSKTRPIALTIAGSDSSGGAGIQADLKTFSALGVYGASALTALTAQNTTGVQAVSAVPPDFVRKQVESVVGDLKVAAVKTGVLANDEIIQVVAEQVRANSGIPLVVDPVMVATSGDVLLEPEAISALRESLFPLATVITPNLDEAAKLLNSPRAVSREQMAEQADRLRRACGVAVLLKGGHLTEAGAAPEASDVLVEAHGETWFSAPLIATQHTHGTGCTLSAAIAAGLARGQPLQASIGDAKTYLTEALAAGAGQRIGHGSGPVDHLVRIA